MKTKLTTTLALAALVLTGCGSATESAQPSEASSDPMVTSSAGTGTATSEGATATSDTTTATTEGAALVDSGYLETRDEPNLSFDDLEDADKAGVRDARIDGARLYAAGKHILWLDPKVPYAERTLIEAAHDSGKDVRWVDGFGTGTLTVYYHGATTPETLKVEQ